MNTVSYYKIIACISFFSLSITSIFSQSAAPSVTFDTVDESGVVNTVRMADGGEQIAQAPCELTCEANLDYDTSEYDKVVCEWKIFDSDSGEDKPLIDRFEENIKYTLTSSGGYRIMFYATFINNSTGMTYDIATENGFKVVISESKLTCTDGLSPNDDNINDVLKIECQSLVKVDGVVMNRWGKVLHRFDVNNISKGWDGKVNGKPVKDGAYILHIDAIGSDGLHYKIKKVINVLKGMNDYNDSDPVG